MTEQLKPCPFCGGDDIDVDENQLQGMSIYYSVYHQCIDRCFIEMRGRSKQEAIDKWNTRAISADEKEQLRRLKDFANDLIDEANSNYSFTQDELLTKSIAYGLATESCSEPKGLVDFAIKADWLKDEKSDKCKHANAKCVYDSDDGEYERWECQDCKETFKVEIPQ